MDKKVILILADGMRPDAIEKLKHPFYEKLKKESSYTLNAKTVMPSITLPCHMSLFHSVEPNRHGTLTNTYATMVRPVTGLIEQLAKFDLSSVMFYTWEELRDIAAPGSLAYQHMVSGHAVGYPKADCDSTESAIEIYNKYNPDFTFLYLGTPDGKGHDYGWMSDEYMDGVNASWDNIEKFLNGINGEYTVIITADHGGHDRIHGHDIPEDMTIPVIACGKEFEKGRILENVNIIDIAPTICDIFGVNTDRDWEGKSFK